MSTLRLPVLKVGACLRPEPFDSAQGLELVERLRPSGSGLTLHFDKLSVLNLSKEAALLYTVFKDGLGCGRTGQFNIFNVIYVQFVLTSLFIFITLLDYDGFCLQDHSPQDQ